MAEHRSPQTPPRQQRNRPGSDVSTAITTKLQQSLALHRQGEIAQAERLYREVLADAPRSFDALHLLGVIEIEKRNCAAAVDLLNLAININPHDATAHFHRGVALQLLNRHGDAVDSYDRALLINPDYAEALNNRGDALRTLERFEEAVASCDRALSLRPGYVEALNNRANALRALKRHEEALVSYDRALTLKSENAEVLNNRGVTLQELRRHADAVACFDRAIRAAPDYAAAHYNRGNALHESKRHLEALASYDRALAIQPDSPAALNNRGNVLRDMGELEAAVACYQASIAVNPDPAVHSSLIFTLLRLSRDGERVRAQCAMFAEQFERRITRLHHPNARDAERRLKVGYVSGDFQEHSVAYFTEPILAHHDRQAVEVYCYSTHGRIDHVTKRLMDYAHHWRSIAGLSDDCAAALVQEDGIDILVDLSGHTSHNRLLTFARKPAPVQVTWIGVPCTTGLSAMDYRLTNPYVDPRGMTERHHSETLVRLSTTTCFPPLAALPPVQELPALSNACITFASFNEFTKISPATYALWSRILNSLPESRLLIVCDAHSSPYAQRALMAHGVAAERLVFIDKLPLADYLALHNRVDIALDTFPYNGGTTTRIALWMGVPVVCLAGSTSVSRFGLALMSQIGLEEFVASDEEQYVQIALRWARDLPALEQVRRTLRKQMQNAAFSNPRAGTRELEAAYRQMWRTWCAGTAHTAR